MKINNKLKFLPYNEDDFYGNRAGSYSTATIKGKNVKQTNYFQSCREEFVDYFNLKTTRILMRLRNVREADQIQKFMNIIERKLKLDAQSRLKFDLLEKNILLITLGKWWPAERIRRDFLTAALRHGRHYTNNFEKTLTSEMYFRETPTAVNKFLSGFTKLSKNARYDYDGWVEYFSQDPLSNLTK